METGHRVIARCHRRKFHGVTLASVDVLLDVYSASNYTGSASSAQSDPPITTAYVFKVGFCDFFRHVSSRVVLTSFSALAQVNAAVVGVHNGMLVNTLNYFPNIIHPIEDLAPFTFKVYHITHKRENLETIPLSADKKVEQSSSTSVELERGPTPVPRHRSTLEKLTGLVGNPDKPKPRVPSKFWSPLNVLSVLSFFLTIGLLIWAALIKDGTAILALGTISLASSIVGYASWWSPELMNRTSHSHVPPGDMIIRTREGAFLLIQCNEDVSRELYIGTEECVYYVQTQKIPAARRIRDILAHDVSRSARKLQLRHAGCHRSLVHRPQWSFLGIVARRQRQILGPFPLRMERHHARGCGECGPGAGQDSWR